MRAGSCSSASRTDRRGSGVMTTRKRYFNRLVTDAPDSALDAAGAPVARPKVVCPPKTDSAASGVTSKLLAMRKAPPVAVENARSQCGRCALRPSSWRRIVRHALAGGARELLDLVPVRQLHRISHRLRHVAASRPSCGAASRSRSAGLCLFVLVAISVAGSVLAICLLTAVGFLARRISPSGSSARCAIPCSRR